MTLRVLNDIPKESQPENVSGSRLLMAPPQAMLCPSRPAASLTGSQLILQGYKTMAPPGDQKVWVPPSYLPGPL